MNKKLKMVIIVVVAFLFFSETDVMAKKEQIVIEKGNSFQMVWEIRRYQVNNRKIKFTSSNKEAVKVTKKGKVKGKKVGKSTITLYVKKKNKYVKKRTWRVIVKREIPYSKQYDYHEYEENGQKYIELDKYHCDNSVVKVPAIIDGIEVKKIGSLCFPHDSDYTVNRHVTKIVIPEGIEEIGDCAMEGIDGLKQVALPTTLNKIGAHLFCGCDQLEKVNYEEIFKFEEIPTSTFSGCKSLREKIKIPSNVKKIGSSAFSNSGIREVKLSEGIEIICDYAFAHTNITKIVIPSTVSKIGDYAFSDSGITEVKLSKGIEIIGTYAFSYTNITKIVIPSTVSEIGYYAFYKTKLNTIVIKSQNIKIHKGAFSRMNE